MGGGPLETISKAQLSAGWNLREGQLSVDTVSKLTTLLSADSAPVAGGAGADGKGTAERTAGGKGKGKRSRGGDAAQTNQSVSDILSIFVKGLDWGTDEEAIRRLFSTKFGEVTGVVLKQNQVSRKPGYAFVTFACAESVAQALEVRFLCLLLHQMSSAPPVLHCAVAVLSSIRTYAMKK
eukprot:COSAG02_NODE_6586_length_3476_cov_2.239266_3_plen_180_part_00